MTYGIPHYIHEAIQRYVQDRQRVGSFLYACFSNNLRQAVCHADENSLACIVDIVKYIWNECPDECQGSSERVERWLRREEPDGEVI